MPRHRPARFGLALVAISLAGCGDSGSDPDPVPPVAGVWRESPAPQITFAQHLGDTAWNDPTVVRDGASYRMWLSGGIPSQNPVVRIHQAWSADGRAWTIDPAPVLTEGPPGAWDSHRVETPCVVKVGSTWHLYYCAGTAESVARGSYDVGHATSADGLRWRRDPANPIIRHHDDPTRWGFYGTGEPGVVVDPRTGLVHLYYVTGRVRDGVSGDLALQLGICLATSSDGSAFTISDSDGDGFADPALVQSAAYPVASGYVGYSTPSAAIDASGVFHLFYDVARYPAPGDWRQVAIAHAVSPDGRTFTEIEGDIIVHGGASWHSWEVRSPSILIEDGVLKLWFAGHTGTPNDWRTAAIGFAVFGGVAQ